MLPSHMVPVLKEFLLRLKQIGAVQIETTPGKGFRLKHHEKEPSAPLSPIYINLRTQKNPKPGPLTRDDVETVGALMWAFVSGAQLTFTGIAGIPRAGEPFAQALQREGFTMGKAQYPLISLEKVERDGTRTIGSVSNSRMLPQGEKVLLVDDLITRADSKLEARDSLRNAGYPVSDVLVFLDREEGGAGELSAQSIMLHSIVSISLVLDFYLHQKLLSETECRTVKQYLRGNR